MTQREWTTQDYLTLLRRWRGLIAIMAILGAVIAYGVSRFIPNRYKSQTAILVEEPTVEFVHSAASDDSNQRLLVMKQQLLSRTRLEPLIHQFGLFPDEANRVPVYELVGRLQSAIQVTPIRPLEDSGSMKMPGFTISVIWDTPRIAQDVCTAVTSMFIQEDLRLRQQHSEDTTQFVSQELTQAKTNLDAQDAKLAAFEAKHIGSLPDQVGQTYNMLNNLYTALDAATQAITRAQMDKSLAQSTLQQQIAARKASQTGKNPETFEEQLSALQTKLATLQATYTDDYPDVVRTKIAIAALQRKIAESDDLNKPGTNADDTPKEPLQFAQLRAQIRTSEQIIADKTKQQEQIQQQIKAAQQRVQATPATEQEYKQLTRDYQTAFEFYKDLLNRRAQSEMTTDLQRRQEGEHYTVLDPANLPDKPDFPDRLKFGAGGLVAGLALGLGLAFLLEMRDTSLQTERDVETSLRLPVLAMIPAIGHFTEKSSSRGVRRMLTGSSGAGIAAEG